MIQNAKEGYISKDRNILAMSLSSPGAELRTLHKRGKCLSIALSPISQVSLVVLSLLLNTQFQSHEEPSVGAGMGVGWEGRFGGTSVGEIL